MGTVDKSPVHVAGTDAIEAQIARDGGKLIFENIPGFGKECEPQGENCI